MSYSDIIYEATGGVARIVINRPERMNSYDANTARELRNALERSAADPEIGIIVLTGAGDRAFCAGGFLGDLVSYESARYRELLRATHELFTLIRRVPQPVIAAVNGYAIGGGNELVIACDLAIASENAKFGQVGPKIGSAPVLGATNHFIYSVGEKRAREVVYLCREYDAFEAERFGWINKVVPPDRLAAEVDAWCVEILDKSPKYLEISKVSLNSVTDAVTSSLWSGELMLLLAGGSDEMIEGVSAFAAKRKPNFRKFRKRSP